MSFQPIASVVSLIDSSPPADSLSSKMVKTPDMKTKTPVTEQSKQQKGAETVVMTTEGESISPAPGLDVAESIERIADTIAPRIVGLDPTDQMKIDEMLQ